VSVTSDVWTPSTTSCSFQSATGHHINSDFEAKELLLGLDKVDGHAGHEDLAPVFVSMLETYAIEKKVNLFNL
jgi:hypothetical protein